MIEVLLFVPVILIVGVIGWGLGPVVYRYLNKE